MSEHDIDDEPAEPELTRILPAVQSSLAEAKGEKRDAGVEALAIRYAELLDQAAVERQYVKAVEMISGAVLSYADGMSQTAGDQMRSALVKVTSALAEHTTASDLGPKLLAAMTALNLTPAARAKPTEKGSGSQGGKGVVPMANPMTALRLAASDRNGRNGAA